MNIKTSHIILTFMLILSCSIALFYHAAPKEGITTEQTGKSVLPEVSGNPYTKLPTYTPTQRTSVTPNTTSSATALPLVNTDAGTYTVHRSNRQVRSIGGGLISTTHNSPALTNAPTSYTPTYNHFITLYKAQATSTPTPRMLAHNPQSIMQRAPGSVDDNYQGWIDDYYGSGYGYGDLTGLKNWWESTYGNGATPDIFEEFYNWAMNTQVPLPDGLLFSLLLAAGYAIRRRFSATHN